MTLYSHLFSSELDETDLTEQETTDETGEDNCEKTCDLCLQMVRKMCNVSRVSRVRNHGKYNKCHFNREIEHFRIKYENLHASDPAYIVFTTF